MNDVCVRPPEEGGNSSGLGSASDDCTACLWDPRQPRREVAKLEHPYQARNWMEMLLSLYHHMCNI